MDFKSKHAGTELEPEVNFAVCVLQRSVTMLSVASQGSVAVSLLSLLHACFQGVCFCLHFRKAVNAGGTSPTANIAFIFLWVHTISLETYGFVS